MLLDIYKIAPEITEDEEFATSDLDCQSVHELILVMYGADVLIMES